MNPSNNVVPPSDDKRWRIINATMRRYGYTPNALIETLHSVQESFGFLDLEALRFVSRSLNVPLSKTYGVATFYHFFQLKPGGKHSCVICTGTACYIKGSGELLENLQASYGIKPGETSEDGALSLLTARCIGSCGLAPVAVLDGVVIPKMTEEQIIATVKAVIDDGH